MNRAILILHLHPSRDAFLYILHIVHLTNKPLHTSHCTHVNKKNTILSTSIIGKVFYSWKTVMVTSRVTASWGGIVGEERVTDKVSCNEIARCTENEPGNHNTIFTLPVTLNLFILHIVHMTNKKITILSTSIICFFLIDLQSQFISRRVYTVTTTRYCYPDNNTNTWVISVMERESCSIWIARCTTGISFR